MKNPLQNFTIFFVVIFVISQFSQPLNATCLALRGNGNWIGAHFGGVAAILEKHGPIETMAGGSSASVTAFLLESMRSHRFYTDASQSNNELPNNLDSQAPLIMAFTLKMLYGYFSEHTDQVFTSIEAFKNNEILSLSKTLMDIDSQDSQSLMQSILRIHQKYQIQKWINPALIQILTKDELPLKERKKFLLDALTNLQSFEVKDQRTFVQPGLLNFEILAGYIGQFADFLSGKSYTDLSVEWMNNAATCSVVTRNLSFSNIRNSMKHEYQECYKISKNILERFSHELHHRKSEDWFSSSYSLDQPIGKTISTFVSTSVSIDSFSNQRIKNIYEQLIQTSIFEDPELNFGRDIRFGYFTGFSKSFPKTNQNIEASLKEIFPQDVKSSLFLDLGNHTWKTALTTSPAEPGLSTAVAFKIRDPSTDISEEIYSLGGWSDLAPVQVLKASGCKNIVYLTRHGEEALLARSSAKILGASDETMKLLFDQTHPEIQSSLETAESLAKTYRTQWNSFSATQILEMSEQAYKTVLDSP